MKQEHWWVAAALAGATIAIGLVIVLTVPQLFTQNSTPTPSASVTGVTQTDTPPRHEPGHAAGRHANIDDPASRAPQWQQHQATLWWSNFGSDYRCYLSVQLERGRTGYVDVPEDWCADLKSEVAHGAR
jgi:hypothetical protein